jgi:hypothetical protein
VQIIDWVINDQKCLQLLCRHIIKALFFDDNSPQNEEDLKNKWNCIFEKEIRFCVEIIETPSQSLSQTQSNAKYQRMIKFFGWDELGTINFLDLPCVECRMFLDGIIQKKWFLQTTSTHASMKKDVLYKAFTKNDFLNTLSPTYRHSIKQKLQQETLQIAQLLAPTLGNENTLKKISQCFKFLDE